MFGAFFGGLVAGGIAFAATAPAVTAPSSAETVGGGSAPTGDDLVVGQGILGSSKVETSDSVLLALVVENRGSTELTIEAFRPLWGSELEFEPGCWSHGIPACDALGVALGPGGLRVPGNQSRTLTASVRAVRAREENPVRGLLVLRSERGIEQLSLEFGDLLVKSQLREAGLWLAGIVVAGLAAVIFQRIERRRAEIQQTWLQMVAKLHEYTEKFYMPLSGAAAGLTYRLELWSAEGDLAKKEAHAKEIFARLVGLSCQMQQMTHSAGWYFQSRDGEAVAEICWGAFYRRLALPLLGDAELRRLVIAVKPGDSSLVIGRKLERSAIEPVASAVRARLRDWMATDFSGGTRFLKLLELVIDYEVNASFRDWYRRKERFPRDRFREELDAVVAWLRKGLASRPSDPYLIGLKRDCCELHVYLEGNSKRLRSVNRSRRRFAERIESVA